MRLDEAEQIHDRALRGDFREVEGAAAALRTEGSPGALAWEAALAMLYSLVAPGRIPRPSPETVAALGRHAEAAPAAGQACGHACIRAVLRMEGEAIEPWRSVAAALDPRAATALDAWSALLRGDATAAAAGAAALERASGDAGDAPRVIEAAVLRSLAALDAGDVSEAVSVARRASRMARTEQLLPHEYLANLALARTRRYAGHAHLAARIASALDQVAPEPWRPWLRWERTLAGERVTAGTEGGPAAALIAALDAAERGDRAGFDSCVEATLTYSAGWNALAGEAADLFRAIDPDADLEAGTRGEIAAWCRGRVHAAPRGIRDRGAAASPAALVLVQPEVAPRRLFRTGLGLVADREGTFTPDEGHQRDSRTHGALAVLALAGAEGVEDRTLFRAVYGFDLVPAKHDGVFRVLLHRARAELGEAASIERTRERLVLRPACTLLLPDPRTQLPLDERILALLASGHGRVTARQIAEKLSIALRSVQSALGQLVEDGACTVERDGRRVEYGVEDTTFYEPSLHRLAASVG